MRVRASGRSRLRLPQLISRSRAAGRFRPSSLRVRRQPAGRLRGRCHRRSRLSLLDRTSWPQLAQALEQAIARRRHPTSKASALNYAGIPAERVSREHRGVEHSRQLPRPPHAYVGLRVRAARAAVRRPRPLTSAPSRPGALSPAPSGPSPPTRKPGTNPRARGPADLGGRDYPRPRDPLRMGRSTRLAARQRRAPHP